MAVTPIGQRILQRLAELDRGQAWLGKHIGRSEATISRWLSGERGISEEDLRAVALVLHRSAEWLRGAETAPMPEEETPEVAVA